MILKLSITSSNISKNMHKEILTEEQIKLLPLLKRFSRSFYLVGGTAIAFHIGHRRSIDFDLFSDKEFDNAKIKRKIGKMCKIDEVFRDETGQYTLSIQGVRFTFFQYPFPIGAPKSFDSIIKLPDLLTLAAMKAYALGRRAKWKDYVDLYFVMEKYHGIEKIVKTAHHIFGKEFNEKLFRSQLAYFKDIDYSEKIIYMQEYEVNDRKIQRALVEFSLT